MAIAVSILIVLVGAPLLCGRAATARPDGSSPLVLASGRLFPGGVVVPFRLRQGNGWAMFRRSPAR